MIIPFQDFGGQGEALHFAHANGYPPQAYTPLLQRLSRRYRVLAMRNRALWPDSRLLPLKDWSIFTNDLAEFLDQHGLLSGIWGVGHSMGANSTLSLALRQPERFRAIVLLDPVLFPPLTIIKWQLLATLGLARRHPMVQTAQKRRLVFDSREHMFENYRSKAVFRRLSDAALQEYVSALACPHPDGAVQLCYPPQWEAAIYAATTQGDMQLWVDLPNLQPPLLVIRGKESDVLSRYAINMLQSKLPDMQFIDLVNTTHLLPLEAPQAVADQIIEFFDSVKRTARRAARATSSE